MEGSRRECSTWTSVYMNKLNVFENHQDYIFSCYGLFRKPVNIIVLEDLKQENFTVLDRHNFFNMDQVQKILQWLAKFHAASVVYVANVESF